MIKAKLKADTMTAMKDHNQVRVDTLRYLTSLIDKKELQLPPGQISEADELSVLQKELKNKEESRKMFADGGRSDLVESVETEIAILKEYLPAEMSEAELQQIVSDAVVEAGNNFGGVMKIVMGKTAGRVGGEKIAPLVKEAISKL